MQKSKELKRYFEKLIATASKGDFNAHRLIFAKLQNKDATNKIVTQIAPRYSNRKGGYTRIRKLGQRRGDNAFMAYIELV